MTRTGTSAVRRTAAMRVPKDFRLRGFRATGSGEPAGASLPRSGFGPDIRSGASGTPCRSGAWRAGFRFGSRHCPPSAHGPTGRPSRVSAPDAMLSRLPFIIAEDLGDPRDGHSDPRCSGGSICRGGSLNRTLRARLNRIAAPENSAGRPRLPSWGASQVFLPPGLVRSDPCRRATPPFLRRWAAAILRCDFGWGDAFAPAGPDALKLWPCAGGPRSRRARVSGSPPRRRADSPARRAHARPAGRGRGPHPTAGR